MQDRQPIVVLAELETADLLGGVQEYVMLHPQLRLHSELIDFDRADEVRQAGQALARMKPAGVLAPLSKSSERMLRSLKIPVVNYSSIRADTFPTVVFDHEAVGRRAAEHLVLQGLRQFAFIALGGTYYATRRFEGFRNALRERGFDALLFDDEFSSPLGRRVSDITLRRWLAQLPLPIGIHTSFTLLGVRLVWACHELGLKVPGDVAIIGATDHTYLNILCEPTLSAFDMPFRKVGYRAMALLHDIIRGKKRPSGPALIPPGHLIQRQSSDRQGFTDPLVGAALRIIRENAHVPMSVKNVLEHLEVSRSTLERRFQTLLKRSIHDEIVRVHIDRSKILLAESRLSLSEVAHQSGFASAPSFSRAFRQQTGLSPRGFRERSENA